MCRPFFKIFCCFFLALILVACGEKECIEADDWGDPKVYVSAEAEDLDITGEGVEQIAGATDSGQVIINAESVPVIISLLPDGQWTSWMGGVNANPVVGVTDQTSGIRYVSGWDPLSAIPDKECEYYFWTASGEDPGLFSDYPYDYASNVLPHIGSFALDMTPAVQKVEGMGSETICPTGTEYQEGDFPADLYADCKVPCYLRYGMGLYVGLAPDDGTEREVIETYHIPDKLRPDIMYDDSLNQEVGISTDIENAQRQRRDDYIIRGMAAQEWPGAQSGDRLYFKIVDRFYGDNNGGYTVRLRSGTRDTDMGPFETMASLFLDPMLNVMQRVFNGYVENQAYINFVRAVLVLAVILYGFSFMMGLVQDPFSEFLVFSLKIALVAVLLSPASWEFFYHFLFEFFIREVTNITAVVVSPFDGFDPEQPWYSMDQVLVKLFSYEVFAKITATMFANPLGFLYTIFLYVILVVFVVALVKAFVLYIVALLGIGILIAIAPIFIVFILFGYLRDMAKEWLDHFFVFAVQEILILASLGMFAFLIVGFMEQTIGYRVCWNTWWHFNIFGLSIYEFKYWLPDIRDFQEWIWWDVNGDGIKCYDPLNGSCDNPDTSVVEVDERSYRYVDAPYLDPVHDKLQIQRMISGSNFLKIVDLLIFLFAVSLMYYFLKFVKIMSDYLSDPSGRAQSAKLHGTAKTMWGEFANTAGLVKDRLQSAYNLGTESLSQVRKRVDDNAEKIAEYEEGRKGSAVTRGGAGPGDDGDSGTGGAHFTGQTFAQSGDGMDSNFRDEDTQDHTSDNAAFFQHMSAGGNHIPDAIPDTEDKKDSDTAFFQHMSAGGKHIPDAIPNTEDEKDSDTAFFKHLSAGGKHIPDAIPDAKDKKDSDAAFFQHLSQGFEVLDKQQSSVKEKSFGKQERDNIEDKQEVIFDNKPLISNHSENVQEQELNDLKRRTVGEVRKGSEGHDLRTKDNTVPIHEIEQFIEKSFEELLSRLPIDKENFSERLRTVLNEFLLSLERVLFNTFGESGDVLSHAKTVGEKFLDIKLEKQKKKRISSLAQQAGKGLLRGVGLEDDPLEDKGDEGGTAMAGDRDAHFKSGTTALPEDKIGAFARALGDSQGWNAAQRKTVREYMYSLLSSGVIAHHELEFLAQSVTDKDVNQGRYAISSTMVLVIAMGKMLGLSGKRQGSSESVTQVASKGKSRLTAKSSSSGSRKKP